MPSTASSPFPALQPGDACAFLFPGTGSTGVPDLPALAAAGPGGGEGGQVGDPGGAGAGAQEGAGAGP
ncbi:hypothetical protein [Actinomadura sp. BRA 177]|uniref:hypothetical protein n=1 Tax=Actinomadura sp. BRA 177 TaxID=2745202 RepID=UPI0015954E95|nr:hypothetical protein [Actinomadura sp. BRA 177]NVI92961.1 hypothetical protein [Actinomadura sp. BRA 177]